MDFLDAIKTCVQINKDKHQIPSSLNDAVCIVNICDVAAHLSTKSRDRTMLTQTISLLAPLGIKLHPINLATPSNLLCVVSRNGK